MAHEAKPYPQHEIQAEQAGGPGPWCRTCGGRLKRSANGWAHLVTRTCRECGEPIKPHNATFWRHVAPPTYPGEGKGGAA